MRFLIFLLPLFAALPVPAPAAADEPGWAERVEFSGDFRLRYEAIDADGLDEQSRGRYRLRLNAGIDLYDDLRFVMALATAADNPVSRNVTFGNPTSDSFGVDLAYIEWQPRPGLEVLAGKMKNPMYLPGRDQLIFDNDLNPSGVAVRFSPGRTFVTAGAFVVRERGASDDSFVYHGQAGVEWELGPATLTTGAGYLTVTNTLGNTPFFFDLPAGNTVDAMNRYVFEYENVEVFASLDAALAGRPLELFAHYTENLEVSPNDSAVALGLVFGKAEAAGSWELGWTFKDLEADAVVGSFTESDFGGGGTGTEGHVLRGDYVLRERLQLGATLFLNDSVGFADDVDDYRRIQLDLEFSFQ
jgi:Putative porin